MSAADTMIRHRYGATAQHRVPVVPHRGVRPPQAAVHPAAPPQATLLTGRELQARRAALELKQTLEAMGAPFTIKKFMKAATPTSYTFVFPVPLETAIQQLGTTALQISSRHGTGVSFLTSYLETTPQAVLVIANDAVLAHLAYKTPFGPR